jgi:dehydrogenase/reductase SDR family protein 12
MSIFRNTVWLVKGLREYTNGGFNAAAKGFNQSDLDVDCKGKAYMITGESSRS